MPRAKTPLAPQDLRRVGSVIRTSRAAKDWTQQQLAEHSGVSLRTITHLEIGQRGAHVRTYGRIARALGIDLDDLIGWT